MEEKLRSDGLEDFLKKSFEDYAESPPGDLWDKIEAGMEPVAPKPLWVRHWWLPAAAAAVVLGIFTCQHFYYKNELSRLSKVVEHHASELQELEENKSIGPAKGHDGTAPQQAVTDRQNDKERSENQALEPSGEPHPTSPSPRSGTAGQVAPATSGDWKKQGAGTKKNRESSSGQVATNTPLGEKPFPFETAPPEISAPVLPTENLAGANLAKVSNPNKMDLPLLKPLEIQASKVDLLSMALTQNLMLPPSAEPGKGGISVGAKAMPMKTREQIKALKPYHPGGHKEFNDETKTNGNSFIAGAVLEYRLGNNWSVATGLDYRKTTFTSVHRPSFTFAEGRHGMGNPHGGMPFNGHDFQYNLNTPTGAVALTLRVEQVDTNQQIPDDEEIDLEIKTRQSLEYVSVPLGLNYRIGKNKLGVNLQGGIVANFLVNHHFDVAEIRSFNPHFKNQRGGTGTGGKQDNLNAVFFDYTAGVGVDYTLSKSWRISLGPTFVGSLTSRHNDRHIQSSSYSAGLNGALTYSF